VFSATGTGTPETTAPSRPGTPIRTTLRPAAIAGACLGAIAGVTFVALAIFWAYRLGRKRYGATQKQPQEDIGPDAQYYKPELAGQSVSELNGGLVISELYGGGMVSELPGHVPELCGKGEVSELELTTTEDE
jgi:hypothetical protein